MFPFKLLEVYYIKNKKSGKRSKNIMVKNLICRLRDSIPGLRHESPTVNPLDQQDCLDNRGILNNNIIQHGVLRSRVTV